MWREKGRRGREKEEEAEDEKERRGEKERESTCVGEKVREGMRSRRKEEKIPPGFGYPVPFLHLYFLPSNSLTINSSFGHNSESLYIFWPPNDMS